MDDFGLSDPKDDMKDVVESQSEANRLLESLERLSTCLVLGVEEYLRAFSAVRSLPQLLDVGCHLPCANQGDCMTLLLRSIALVLEHVPDSNTACNAYASTILALASKTLQNVPSLAESMVLATASTLAEECLRVILFVVRDDATGMLVATGFLREVLGTLDWADARITRQCFDIIHAVCAKVNFSSTATVAKSTARQKNAAAPPATSNKTVLSELIDRLLPQLHTLAHSAPTMTHYHIVLEGALQALGLLVFRAHRQHQHKVVSAVTTSDAFQLLFHTALEDVRRGDTDKAAHARVSHTMTVLLNFAICAPAKIREQLLTAKAIDLFSHVLHLSTPESFSKLLEDPFGTSRAVQPASGQNVASMRFPESEHNCVVMALQCIVAALPSIPTAAFGTVGSISFLAVHRWLWEDDVHSFSEYPPDQWPVLDAAVAQQKESATVKVRGRTFDINIHDLKQANGRNIARSFTPQYFLYLQPPTVADPAQREIPLTLGDIDVAECEAPSLHLLYRQYLHVLCDFCPRAPTKPVKVLTLWAVASLVHCELALMQKFRARRGAPQQHVPSSGPTTQSFLPLLCGTLVDALAMPEDDAVPAASMALSCLDWLLHNQADGSASLQFATVCTRFGIPEALQVCQHFTSRDCSHVVMHADVLLTLLEASSSPVRCHLPNQSTRLAEGLAAFNEMRDNRSHDVLADSLQALMKIIAASKDLTSFEFANATTAASIVAFLKCTPVSRATPLSADSAYKTPTKQSTSQQGAAPAAPPLKEEPAITRKQRIHMLRSALSENPEALQVLVTKIASVLPFVCPLPMVESTVSAHAVVMRPLNEVLTILSSLSPRIALCEEKPRDVAYVEQRSLLESDLESLCPSGHRMYNRIATGWVCDVCSGRSAAQNPSMRCDSCDFDICFQCFRNPEVGYAGGLPDHQAEEGLRPGRTFHILSSVGDVERYFRSGDGRGEYFYDGIGRCKMQESILSVFYRKAFQRKLTTVLEQFENSLLRIDVAAEQANAKQHEVTTMVSSFSGSGAGAFFAEPSGESFDNSFGGGSPVGLVSPLRGLMFSANRRAASFSPSNTPVASRKVVHQDSAMRGIGKGISIREFGEQCVTKARTYFFHSFASRKADRCNCGENCRKDFATEVSSSLRQKPSAFELQPEVQLLLLLHELFSGKQGQQKNSGSPFPVVSEELTILVLKSLCASALRVAILPFVFAVPRWVSFICREAPFLLSQAVREKISRYVCYGAKKSLWDHIRKLNLSPLKSPGGVAEPIETPAEWHQELCLADATQGHKYTVSREALAESSLSVLLTTRDARFPLAIEFAGDKGTGSGPTIQWFALLAKYALRKDNAARYWRGGADSTSEIFVPSREGVFPLAVRCEAPDHDTDVDDLMRVARPTAKTPTDEGNTTVASCLTMPADTVPLLSVADEDFFYLIGAALGRAFVDQRVLPLPLSRILLEWLRVNPPPLWLSSSVASGSSKDFTNILSAYRLSIDDVMMVDEALARQLQYVKGLAQQARGDTSTDTINAADASAVKTEIEALGLFFILPGVDSFDLLSPAFYSSAAPCEAALPVTRNNALYYVQRVCECITFEASAIPIHMIWRGFTDVSSNDGLVLMELDELSVMLLGDSLDVTEALWSEEELLEVLTADHGYTMDSLPIKFLVDILVNDLSPAQQRKFLEFCTGCPRLPLGGLRALGPITVVRRSNDAAEEAISSASNPAATEWALPTVNTCFRYLKLPPYPTKEMTLAKLLLAVEHCSTTFELS